jgi:hypothetical protein
MLKATSDDACAWRRPGQKVPAMHAGAHESSVAQAALLKETQQRCQDLERQITVRCLLWYKRIVHRASVPCCAEKWHEAFCRVLRHL